MNAWSQFWYNAGRQAGELSFQFGLPAVSWPAMPRLDWLTIAVAVGLVFMAVTAIVAVLISYSKGSSRRRPIPEVTALPARAARELDLRIVSHEDARRIAPDFFRRRISRSLADALAFSESSMDLARRFLQYTASKFPAEALTLFLRNESLYLEPMLQLRGGFISGNAVEGPHVSEDDMNALETGRVVVSGDSSQALVPIDAPTEVAGILHVAGLPGSCEGARLGMIYEICRQFSLLFYERVRHERATSRNGAASGIRFEEDLALLCGGRATFALICLEAPVPPGILPGLPHRTYQRDGLFYLLGPVESDEVLDQHFRDVMKVTGQFNAGIALSSGGEKPDRVILRARAALDNARKAGVNHYRVLDAA